MLRIIFDNGEIADCEHINKLYVEVVDLDKITVVGNIEDLEGEDERSVD